MYKALTAVAALILSVVSLSFLAFAHSPVSDYGKGIVFKDGSIRLPENFRTDYVMIGTWSVVGDADTGGDLGLHLVYADRESVEAYRRDGKFPDGAVLVKEPVGTKTETLTTGEASSATETQGYFVMVKDEKGRFPDNKLWGNGWGWAFFSADDTQNTVTKDYKAECLGCHQPAQETDLVYDYAYPILHN